MFVVIEGTDGSGKATQTKLLADRLKNEGRLVQQLSFPCYGDPGCALVEMYLKGKFGPRPEDVNPYAAAVFYAVDRYASFKTGWGDFLTNGGIVIADRYTTSNAVHQAAKLSGQEREVFLDWLFDIEYGKMGLPRPDKVFYLDVDPTVSQRLMSERYSGDENKKDIHERDVAYQQKSRESGLFCANRFGWERIRCDDGIGLRSVSEIADEIYQMCRKTPAFRHGELPTQIP